MVTSNEKETFERLDEDTVRVTRFSPVSKTFHTLDLNITQAQWDAWVKGQVIQRAMCHLSDSDREFLVSGITEEEWKTLWGKYDKGKESAFNPVIK